MRSLPRIARSAIGIHAGLAAQFDEFLADLRTTRTVLVSDSLKLALVIGEDHRFWSHCGLDLRALARAIVRTTLWGRPEGASTIQQQLVRVVSGRYERTLSRKLREILFAISLGDLFSREQLIALYLTRGYYGYGMSGLDACCRSLGVNPALATAPQSAAIVARLRYPERRVATPIWTRRLANRTQYILAKMATAASELNADSRASRPPEAAVL